MTEMLGLDGYTSSGRADYSARSPIDHQFSRIPRDTLKLSANDQQYLPGAQLEKGYFFRKPKLLKLNEITSIRQVGQV
jgi:hypothetical protein